MLCLNVPNIRNKYKMCPNIMKKYPICPKSLKSAKVIPQTAPGCRGSGGVNIVPRISKS